MMKIESRKLMHCKNQSINGITKSSTANYLWRYILLETELLF